ncbi:MAG: hypothetical protein K5Q00_00190 [Gammaproteobacteria bacterium]|nr:hypothetical protein [Gammaproteobacteria bacterium]
MSPELKEILEKFDAVAERLQATEQWLTLKELENLKNEMVRLINNSAKDHPQKPAV